MNFLINIHRNLRIVSTIMKNIDFNAENTNLPLLPLLGSILEEHSPNSITCSLKSHHRGATFTPPG